LLQTDDDVFSFFFSESLSLSLSLSLLFSLRRERREKREGQEKEGKRKKGNSLEREISSEESIFHPAPSHRLPGGSNALPLSVGTDVDGSTPRRRGERGTGATRARKWEGRGVGKGRERAAARSRNAHKGKDELLLQILLFARLTFPLSYCSLSLSIASLKT